MFDEHTAHPHPDGEYVAQINEMLHELSTLAYLDPDNPGPDTPPPAIPAAEWAEFIDTGRNIYGD